MLARAALAWIVCAYSFNLHAENPRLKREFDAAVKDRASFPQSDWWRYYYVTTSCSAPKPIREGEQSEQQAQEIALKLVVASTSRQVVLENCAPVKVSPTLYRLDLANLYWDVGFWGAFISHYPYANVNYPLVLRSDWLILALTDANELDKPFYYALLFGEIPKNRDRALEILKVSQEFDYQAGWIEAQSGVAVNGKRWIAKFALLAANGWAYGTRDVFKLDRDHDMLEHPDGSFKHDAEEWIIGLTKKHNESGTVGALQGYLLSDGKGNLVTRADVRAVEDHSRFRGSPEIRVPGGCINCHPGLNFGTVDDLRTTLESGVTARADYKNSQRIQSFHFSKLDPQIKRSNEDYAAIVNKLCGCTPKQSVAAFKKVIAAYDRPLTLKRAAWECGVEPEQMQNAIALADLQGAQFPAEIARLAHGLTSPRISFEPAYKDLNYTIVPRSIEP